MLPITIQPIEIALSALLKVKADKEKRKRLYHQECRFNLALLSILDWKADTKLMSEYIVPKLKSEIATLMLINFKNDFLNITANQLRVIFQREDDEPDANDLFTQVINKIELLKIIVNIPEELKKNDRSKLNHRIENLRTSLLKLISKLDR